MKTKKTLFGLLGSLAALFVCFLPVLAPLGFNLRHENQQKIELKT
jgi:hypothetical protein